MTRNEFFNAIMNEIAYIPEKKLQEIITYYNSVFDSELAKGRTEEDIIKSFGDINKLINDFKSNSNGKLYTPIEQIESFKPDLSTENYTQPMKNQPTEIINVVDNSELKETPIKQTDKNPVYKIGECSNNPLINGFLKLSIFIAGVVILFPVLSAIIGFILGLFGTSLGLFTGSLGILIGRSFFDITLIPEIPTFITAFPYPALVFFCLGTMCLGILMFFSLLYISKALIVFLRNIFIKVLP